MSNVIDFTSHRTIDAPFYHRQYEHDASTEQELPHWLQTGQRIALIAIPFLSLHKPLSLGISTGMGSFRVASHVYGAYTAGAERNWAELTWKIVLAALAAFSLAATVFNFPIGHLITSAFDILQNLVDLIRSLAAGNFAAAASIALQMVSSLTYVGLMLTGSLELVLISLILNAATCLFTAFKECRGGRLPETIAQAAMGCIRSYQAYGQFGRIQRRNEILRDPLYQRLIALVQNGRKTGHLLNSPLNDLAEKVDEKKAVLDDGAGNEYDFGSNFHGHGKQAVKGANLCFRTKIVDGKEMLELDFKINHVFRDRIQGVIADMEKLSESEKAQELLELAYSHAKTIKVEDSSSEFGTPTKKLSLEGLGSISIGANATFPTMYDRVVVQMSKESSLYHFHELLSFVNLQDAVATSALEDLERLKIGHLFRQFYPSDATAFERTDAFFDLPLDKLKEKLIEMQPGAEEVFEKYLPQMEKREIVPGRMRYAMPGVAKEAEENGARALISTLTGVIPSSEALFQRITAILKLGMLSSETRKISGIGIEGLSTGFDFITGGSDSVFTQLLTENNCKEQMPLSDLYYSNWGSIRFVISTKALEMGTYQYHNDNFGERIYGDHPWGMWGQYGRRENINDFAREENRSFNIDNEVMIKERIAPDLITCLVVPNEEVRIGLIDHLRGAGLVRHTPKGETILGKPLERFIRVTDVVSDDLVLS